MSEEIINEGNGGNPEFYIVRTVPSKEAKFLDQIWKVLSKKEGHGIRALFSPETVKGYIFAEAESLTSLIDSLRNVPNMRGVIKTPVKPEELEKYFEEKGEAVVVNERDIVEIISGPFKGDRAKVIRVIPGKDEIIVEPLNVPVPIPITMGVDDIRVIEEENLEGEN
jgi:transcriptional antiterminator NusG